MKKKIFITITMIFALSACNGKPTSKTIEVLMAPLEAGTKTDDYEVISPTELKLAPGVKLQFEEGDRQSKGFVLLRNNGGLGGYMACGCVGATDQLL